MSNFVGILISIIVGIVGIIFGTKQHSKIKEVEKENKELNSQIIDKCTKENNTIQEVKDVKQQLEQIHKITNNSSDSSNKSKLDKLRNKSNS